MLWLYIAGEGTVPYIRWVCDYMYLHNILLQLALYIPCQCIAQMFLTPFSYWLFSKKLTKIFLE